MVESKLHKSLKYKAVNYLFDKSCWVARPEVDCGYYGIYDAWGIKTNFHCIGIEVKVSRGDFKNNKRKEQKLGMGVGGIEGYIPANTNYILCPEGLLYPEDMDERYGLLWFNGERLVNKKKAVFVEMTDWQKLNIVMHLMASKNNKYSV